MWRYSQECVVQLPGVGETDISGFTDCKIVRRIPHKHILVSHNTHEKSFYPSYVLRTLKIHFSLRKKYSYVL